MNIVTRRQTAALTLHSRPAGRRASSDDALAHVPCFGMELLERRILYAATYAMSDLLIEPDGSAIIVGQTSNTTEIGLWRMNPDGTVDTSFGTNGAFLLKMAFMVLAGLNALAFDVSVRRSGGSWVAADRPPSLVKGFATLSLVFWLCVVTTGRWMAYL